MQEITPDVANGLSPLARGTLLAGEFIKIHWRFIPAGAGNSQSTKGYGCNPSVYPRWRGELVLIRPC
ncbi:hypothetical protein EC12741_0732 [Escherichia coli 1.2741]|nr:hypothetical protein ECSTEC7V_3331 [Escherichia coli STEC_7v]EIG78640.1 hypothetical protein EC12741_0732 [Escherichia coli 1.2741]